MERPNQDILHLTASQEISLMPIRRSLYDPVDHRDIGGGRQLSQFGQTLFLFGPAFNGGADKYRRFLAALHRIVSSRLLKVYVELFDELVEHHGQIVERDGLEYFEQLTSRIGRQQMREIQIA